LIIPASFIIGQAVNASVVQPLLTLTVQK